MGKAAPYKQAKGTNNLEERQYLTWFQEERFMENKCNKEEKQATLKLGSKSIQSINQFVCYGAQALSWETADSR